MTQTQHTPVPWEWKQTRGNNHFEHQVFAGCQTIADLDGDTSENVKANAEFIVRACNCHDEMLEALEFIVSGERKDGTNYDQYDAMGFINIAKRIIKKVKGEL